MDIVNFVVQPTWKEMLTQLVASEQMDPWDIDVGLVATKYMEKLKEMEALDLRVPANVILAASLLLRFKAEDLWVAEEEVYEEPILQNEVLPELVFRANRPRRRRVTLDELVSSLEQVIRKGKKQTYSSKSFLPALLFEVPKEEMDQRMEYVFNQIGELKDAGGIVRFTELLQEKNTEQVAKYLLPVLHLVQEHRIYAWQDEFFGDIFLKQAEQATAKIQAPKNE
ncbi:segregation/condensation protein A [Candidatus Micrarchaeota archaeon]|nr:segregation/condensation protein A [Candidatus Micrarchaeota archaeon]